MKALDILLKRLEEQIDKYEYTYDVTFEYDKQFEDLIRSAIKEYNELVNPKDCDGCHLSEYCDTHEDCKSNKYLRDRYQPKDK